MDLLKKVSYRFITKQHFIDCLTSLHMYTVYNSMLYSVPFSAHF